jgi:hypothetical protein
MATYMRKPKVEKDDAGRADGEGNGSALSELLLVESTDGDEMQAMAGGDDDDVKDEDSFHAEGAEGDYKGAESDYKGAEGGYLPRDSTNSKESKDAPPRPWLLSLNSMVAPRPSLRGAALVDDLKERMWYVVLWNAFGSCIGLFVCVRAVIASSDAAADAKQTVGGIVSMVTYLDAVCNYGSGIITFVAFATSNVWFGTYGRILKGFDTFHRKLYLANFAPKEAQRRRADTQTGISFGASNLGERRTENMSRRRNKATSLFVAIQGQAHPHLQ